MQSMTQPAQLVSPLPQQPQILQQMRTQLSKQSSIDADTYASVQCAYHIGEPSEVSAVRRAASALCRQLGFDEVRAGQVAIVVTEAATNIVKHAVHGDILLRPLQHGAARGIEIVAIDAGPGMSDVTLQLRDGQSTVGTYGVGLGAIGRLTQEFDYYSLPGKGTVLSMTLWQGSAPPPAWDIGAVCLPLAGEMSCGDAWSCDMVDDGLALIVADGLGHGPEAAAASALALRALALHPSASPAQLVQLSHTAMRASRGAALAAVRIDLGTLHYAGVGNIAGCVLDNGTRRHLLSHNGIVGSNLRKVQQFESACPAGATLVLHSDGIGTRWDLDAYPGLLARRCSIIAAVLYRDFARANDDSTVLVLRQCVTHSSDRMP